MKSHSNLRQENLDVPSAQTQRRSFLHLDEEIAREETWFGVISCESHVVVLGLEIELLLFREEDGKPCYDSC